MTLAMSNYIETENPFSLARPPASFLVDLLAYDDKLVIFASKVEPVFRLCRKVSGTMPWEKFPPGHLDNPLMFANRMVPIKAIFPSPQWGQVLIRALAGCDVQRVGGGVAAAEMLDQSEELERRRLDLSIADEAQERAGTAYRAIGYMDGSRISLATKNHEGGGYKKNPFGPVAKTGRRPYRPRGSGDHAIFTGR